MSPPPQISPRGAHASSDPIRSPLFVLVAGEASGDQLGASLIADLKARFPAARFAGVGGPSMHATGMQIWHPSAQLSVMGYGEVLRQLPRLLALRRDVCKRTLLARPQVFIGIDAPDFNLGIERKLKVAGILCAHYVSPSVWAWREKRVLKIGRSADRVLCLFPMEPAIYTRHGIDASFVGHPLADQFAIVPDRKAARCTLGVEADALVLALLPGSRLDEITRLGSDFAKAAAILRGEFPQLQIIAPMASAECRAAFERLLREQLRASPQFPAQIRLLDGHSHAAMIAADVVLLASGTAALEAMLAKRPMVVAYRVASTTYRIVKGLGMLRSSVYSLPNILAGETIVPELMQDACSPQALAAALTPLLHAPCLPAATLAQFVRIHESLRPDAAHNAAAAVAEMLEPVPPSRNNVQTSGSAASDRR